MEEGSKWMLAMCRDIGGNLLDDGLNGKRLNGWWPPARDQRVLEGTHTCVFGFIGTEFMKEYKRALLHSLDSTNRMMMSVLRKHVCNSGLLKPHAFTNSLAPVFSWLAFMASLILRQTIP
eukprot:1160382-Pelagomonas_calceolata.AAC.14